MTEERDPRSGVRDDGSWTPAFPSQRPPLPHGHELSTTHGCYSVAKLTPRAEQIRAGLEPLLPVRSPADGAALDGLCMSMAQLERATIVLSTVQTSELEQVQNGGRSSPELRDDLRRLNADARGWANTVLRYLDALGMTPMSRARLSVDLMRIEPSMVRLLQDEARSKGSGR